MLKLIFFPFYIIGWLMKATVNLAVFIIALGFLIFILGLVLYGVGLYTFWWPHA